MNSDYIAAIYARISVSESKEDNISTSIVNQKNIIRDFCLKEGIQIYDYYVDDGYSGGNFDRPSFKRLLLDIKKGLINCVITKDISRLGRDFISTGEYIYKFFPDNDIRYIAVLDNYDSLVPALSDDIIPFKAVLNDMYLKDISKKIKSSRHDLMRKGFFMGSTVPYGYKRSLFDSRLLEIDDYAAKVVKRIFSMREKGLSATIIARKLTHEKVLPPNIYNNKEFKWGHLSMIWKSATINYILKNIVYTGTLIQRKYDRVSLKSKRKRLLKEDEWIILENNHPSIIDRQQFELVNNLCKGDHVRNRKYDYLLKGLVHCNECSSTMLVRKLKSSSIYCCRTYAKYRDNICTMHYFREDVLNELIFKSLDEQIKIIDVNSIARRIGDDYYFSKLKSVITNIDNKIKKLLGMKLELYKDKLEGVVNENDFNMINDSIKLELMEQEKEKNRILESLKENETLVETIIKEGLNINKKEIISKFISNITIDEDKVVRIFYKFRRNFE